MELANDLVKIVKNIGGGVTAGFVEQAITDDATSFVHGMPFNGLISAIYAYGLYRLDKYRWPNGDVDRNMAIEKSVARMIGFVIGKAIHNRYLF